MTDNAADQEPSRNLPNTSPDAPAEARDQADAYESLFGTTDLPLDDGTVMKIPPHPSYNMLDDEKMEAWDELMFDVDTKYDREPDVLIPEHRLLDKDGNETGPLQPAETIRGALLRPFRANKKLVKPPHAVKIVQVALGDVEYKRLRAGGKSTGDVFRIWNEQGLRIAERQKNDPKSAGGAVDLAAVSEADS